jgi:hypothetical protein
MRLEAGDGAPTKQMANALHLQARLAIAAFGVRQHVPVWMTAIQSPTLDTGQAGSSAAAEGAPAANVSATLAVDQHAVRAYLLV